MGTYQFGKDLDLPFKTSKENNFGLLAFYLVDDPEDIVPAIRPNSSVSNEVTLVLLRGNGIVFVEAQDDPFFSAHQDVQYINDTGKIPAGYHRYQMDRFLNIIACSEQYRFCSSITDGCTQWEGLIRPPIIDVESDPVLFGSKLPGDNSETLDFVSNHVLVQMVMQETALSMSIRRRGQAALQASRFLNDGEQARLLPEQWKFELEYWFMMALARLQLAIFNTIERPANLDAFRATNLWQQPKYKLLLSTCGRIKYKDPHHTSLSTFGLIMILVFSGVILFGSFIAMILPSNMWTKRWIAVMEWQRDEVLALVERREEQVRPTNAFKQPTADYLSSLAQ
jgi:hypothetical protein